MKSEKHDILDAHIYTTLKLRLGIVSDMAGISFFYFTIFFNFTDFLLNFTKIST